jgi:hypothetical protein
MALHSRRFNDINITPAKSQDVLAEFPKACNTKHFKWWNYHWAHCMCVSPMETILREKILIRE